MTNQGLLGKLESHVFFDLRQQCKKLSKLHLIPNIFGEPLGGILQQKYFSDLTIVPKMTMADSLKAISHPSEADMKVYLLEGQRATWPFIFRLQSLLKIESELDTIYRVYILLMYFNI